MNKMNKKQQWGCGSIALVLLLICGATILLPRLFGEGDNVTDVEPNEAQSDAIFLGDLTISESIDSDGCPLEPVMQLENSNRFYVVAPESSIPEGTNIFARLYQDGAVVEDLPLITANQDYSNTCVNFVFETTNGSAFAEGQYIAEFWVNGNAYNSIQFTID